MCETEFHCVTVSSVNVGTRAHKWCVVYCKVVVTLRFDK